MTTTTCFAASGANVRKMPRSKFVEHDPALKRKFEFVFDADFRRRYEKVVQAVRHCASRQGSQWSVVKKLSASRGTSGSLPASGGTCAASLPASGGPSIEPPSGTDKGRKPKLIGVSVNTLADLWQFLQNERRVTNSKHAPLLWRAECVGM